MKRILHLLLLLFFFVNGYSQVKVQVKGYYIEKYKKREIIGRIKSDSLRKMNRLPKSYSIGHYLRKHFFTLNVDSVKLMEKEDIVHFTSLSRYKEVDIYRFPPYYGAHMKKYLESISSVSSEYPFRSKSVYYCIPSDSIYLYKVFQIKGAAMRITIDNDYLIGTHIFNIAINWDTPPTWIDKRVSVIYGYIFYQLDYISNSEPPPGFVEWDYMNEIYPLYKEIDWYKEMDWYELDDNEK